VSSEFVGVLPIANFEFVNFCFDFDFILMFLSCDSSGSVCDGKESDIISAAVSLS
jgi:hypothetical protein